MMENPDTNYVSYGHFALLADNYHWDNAGVDASSVFRELISRNRFPIYPDVLSIIVCKSGSFSLISGGRRITAGPKSAIVIFGRQPIDDVEISEDFRLFFFPGKAVSSIPISTSTTPIKSSAGRWNCSILSFSN